MNPANDYIRIALAKANGNKTLAKKALIELAIKDADLAQALALPFLEGICTQAIDRYLRTGPLDDFKAEPVEDKPKDIPPTEASDKHRDAVMKMVSAFKKRDQ